MLCKGQLSWECSDCSEMCSDLELDRCKTGEKYSGHSRAAACIRDLRQENTLCTGATGSRRQVRRQPTDVVEGGVAVLVPVTNHES